MHTMRTPDSIANAFDALEVARRRGVTRRDDLYEELYRRQCIGWARTRGAPHGEAIARLWWER